MAARYGTRGSNTLTATSVYTELYGRDGNDILRSSTIAGVSLYGENGNDALYAKQADLLIDGGDGTDTFVADLTEQAGSGTTTGAVINLSASAISQSTVFSVTGAYLAASNTSVASNTATYLFNSESTTNDNVVDTLAGIENVTGTSGSDYIVGSADANVVTALGGIDYITLGAGADSVVFKSAASANRDIVLDFAGADDKLVFDISDLGLAGGDVYVGAIGSLDVDSSKEVVVLTGVGYASDDAAEDAVAGQVTTDALDAVVVYFNTTTAKVHVIHDTDAGADGANGTATLIGVLNNITTLAGLAALTSSNFGTVA